MSQSAQSVQRSAYMVIAFVLVFGGIGFGYFVWTGTQVYPDGRGPDAATNSGNVPRMAPAFALKVEERTPGGVCVLATITNTGTANTRLTIPDLMGIEPLYTVSLKYAASKTGELHDLPRVLAMQNRVTAADLNPGVPYNAIRDVQVDLNPGRSHVVVIPVGQWYVMNPGHYEVRVSFRPTELVADGDFKVLPQFNVGPANAMLAFDLPIPSEKPAVAPANSAAKNPDSALKTVEAPTANK